MWGKLGFLAAHARSRLAPILESSFSWWPGSALGSSWGGFSNSESLVHHLNVVHPTGAAKHLMPNISTQPSCLNFCPFSSFPLVGDSLTGVRAVWRTATGKRSVLMVTEWERCPLGTGLMLPPPENRVGSCAQTEIEERRHTCDAPGRKPAGEANQQTLYAAGRGGGGPSARFPVGYYRSSPSWKLS